MDVRGWMFDGGKDEKSGTAGIFALFSFVLIFLVLITITIALALPLASASSSSPGAIVNANFGGGSNDIGVVGQDFYGVNVHNSWLMDGRMVDANGDGSREAPSDTAWNRQTFTNGGFTYAREDMSLANYYDGWYNGGAEDWLPGITSANTNSDSEVEDAPFGWYLETSSSGGGSVSRSTDSHSGSYSANLVASSQHGEWNFKDVNFKAGHTYVFSVWVKSSDTVDILIQSKAGDWSDVCSSSSTGSGGWEQISCSYTPSTDVAEGYRLPIIVGAGESTLWDDASLTDDGNPISWWRKGDLNDKLSEYAWAEANGVRILNIISYMPKFLADLSSGCTNGGLDDCAPTDYTKFGEIVKDYVDRSTNNGQYLGIVDYEDWNEPDTGLLGDYASSDQRKADEYVRIHTAVRDSLKSAYPNICIGGTGSSWFEDGPLIDTYFENFKDDCFFSFHIYEPPLQVNMHTKVQQYINSATSKCNSYNANCSRIIISEYGLDHTSGDDDIRNTPSRSDEYGADFSLFYTSTLNLNPAGISMVAYQWADQYKYSQSGSFPEYPHQWDCVVEPAMGVEYKPPYTVTDNFSTYHSPGSMVVKSNSSSANVRVVASKKGDEEHITVVNTGSTVDVAVNVYGQSLTGLQDLKTGQIYTSTNGNVYIGNVNQFQIRYFIGVNEAVSEPPVSPPVDPPASPPANTTNTSTTNNTSTSGGSGSSGSGSGSGTSGGSSGGGTSSTQCNSTVKSQTCVGLGFASGTLTYNATCVYNTSKCVKNSTSINTVNTTNTTNTNTTNTNTTNTNTTNTNTTNTNTTNTTSITNTTTQNNTTTNTTTTTTKTNNKNTRSKTRFALFRNRRILSLANVLFFSLITLIFASMIYAAKVIVKKEEKKHYTIKYHPER